MNDAQRGRRMWKMVFLLPAFVPLVLNGALGMLTRDPELLKAMGPGGRILLAKISTALSLTVVVMMVLGLVCVGLYGPRAGASAARSATGFP